MRISSLALLLCLGLGAQEIIPAPSRLERHPGQFTLGPATRIVALGAAGPIGEGLAADLRPATGLALPLAGKAGKDTIALQLDPALALGDEGYRLEASTDRVLIRAGDVALRFSHLALPPFDAAFANPPFFDDPRALRAPDPSRRGAWMADDGLAAWCEFLLKAVREGGRVTLVHRADRLADLLALLAPKAGSFRLRPVHPFPDAPAKRVLVRAVKTGKAPLVLLPPLILRDRGADADRPAVAARLRGESGRGWV